MYKRQVEDCLPLDANRLARQGWFAGSYRGPVTWTDGSTITLAYSQGQLTLSYRLNGEPMQQAIEVIEAPCHFGGNRFYFRCPACHKRRYKLRSGPQGFYCRHCYALPYYSQECGDLDGLIHQKHKIEAKLGKPMRTTTRMKVINRLCALDDEIDRAMINRFGADEMAIFGVYQ